jgi:hypothetical protein
VSQSSVFIHEDTRTQRWWERCRETVEETAEETVGEEKAITELNCAGGSESVRDARSVTTIAKIPRELLKKRLSDLLEVVDVCQVPA